MVQYLKGNVQRKKQIGKLTMRKKQIISHKTLGLRTQELGKGLRNLITARRRQRRQEGAHRALVSILLPSPSVIL